MKQFAFVILSFLVSTIASARCTSSGIYCLSERPTLNKNGLIILEFYAFSQDLVSQLNKKHAIYLQGSHAKVPLNIIEILKGEMSLTQVVLKPGAGLKAGEIYSLRIDNLPKHEQRPERYVRSTNRREELTFKINNSVDTDIPILNSTPAQHNKTLVQYGCGPARWVYFNLSGEDESELFVRARVKNKSTGLITTYILNIEKGFVKVGHGMCSGAFHFEGSDQFEVAFQLFDQSGNKSTLTDMIAFTRPTVSTNEE